jgi:lipopolysaccharide/colanic/teichoic acid biosynthesis glycosyltransferase
MVKRAFDVTVSAIGLAALAPVLLVAAVAVWLDSPGGIFFRQERVGRDFQPFRIYKFRTMFATRSSQGAAITPAGDRRITRVGRFLRAAKIDELPQLLNVIKGEMSLVGPRPEVRSFVELFEHDYREILTVRPGITDLASLKYRDESGLLAAAADPHHEYVARILPDKIRLAKEYVACASLLFDLRVIVRTLVAIARRPKMMA